MYTHVTDLLIAGELFKSKENAKMFLPGSNQVLFLRLHV